MAFHPTQFGQKGAPKNGSITVLVLVFVVLLTFIVVAFLEEATSKIKYYGLFHNRDDLRVDAYSALEISLAVINQYREIEGALWGPAQGWSNPLQQVGFTPAHASSVSVSFEDESAKLGLESLEYDDLIILFDVMGFDLPEAQALADGLIDWTDEDDARRLNGFDGEDYEDMDPPYKPANSAIVSWDEFRLIQPFNELFFDEAGSPTSDWASFKNAVSLYHSGKTNINQASGLVLDFLAESGFLDPYSLADYKNGIDGISGTEDDRLIRNLEEAALGETSDVSTGIELLRVKVRASRGDARFDLEALVSWSGSDAGAADSSQNRNQAETNSPEEDAAPDSSAAQRNRSRGSARTAPAISAELGYPFRFIRIVENRKF
ncbi:general secretion pathway protein GspK [Puniceicoccales bacterium CK1056]|uniref:General secretion pathway protein GspK n=1 Tax=Oceanipulchritudo coccoides TaxID=2706888 RepID=A0A6B2M328_9BACT|nr:type II secretion system protein GspK [Oceanipulchritudo coccoides]NDV62504.1 general secretion pathway protein GspK [Oceanipulchritudo coccoides]